MSTFTVPSNARKFVGLHANWVGNCVYFIESSLLVREVVEDDSLSKMAFSIRTALNKRDNDTVGGLFELRRPQTFDLAWRPIIEGGPGVLGITSFYHSDLYAADFGPAVGTVKHFTTTDIGAIGGFGRVAYVGARLPGGPGVDVALGMDAEEFELVEKDGLWNKYFRKFQENCHI